MAHIDEFTKRKIQTIKKQNNKQMIAIRRSNIFSVFVICLSSQLVMLWLIGIELLGSPDAFLIYEIDPWEMIARIVCANMLHLSMLDEFKRGLDSMKYVLSHYYRF